MAKKTRKPKTNKPNKQKDKDRPFKGQSVRPEDEDRYEAGKENDPSWYSVSNQMVKDTCNVSFNNPAGIPLKLFTGSGAFDQEANKEAIPGVMAFNYYYGPGDSWDSNSALNLAARNIYAFVRHVNSGAANYEAADLMLYLFGIGSTYVLYSELIRLYGFTLQYRQSNRYFNAAIIEAMGYDVKDIEDHLPQLRFTINKLVRKMGTKPIPANLNIMHRMMYLPSQVFEDATVRKSQLYLFKPIGFYTYVETDPESETGAYLKWNTRTELIASTTGGNPTRLWTYDDINAITEFIMNSFLDSEDIGIISGDIMKAYGSNVMTLTEIDESFMLQPFYSDEILDQIHNMTMVGNLKDLNVTQQYNVNLGNELLWRPRINWWADQGLGTEMRRKMLSGKQYLDLPYDEPSPIDVMVATRLLNTANGGLLTMMTEVVDSAVIYFIKNGVTQHTPAITSYYGWEDDDAISWPSVLNIVNMMSKFDKHPQIRFAICNDYVSETDPSCVYAGSCVDLYNYTAIGDNELSKMHETALLSLWDVPETAFYKAT